MEFAVGPFDAMRDIVPLAVDVPLTSASFTHDRTLMALSMVVAVLGAFASLLLGARAQAHSGPRIDMWLAASGAAMGAGVWAMHFVGLVALDTPLLRGFDVSRTIASLALAVAFGASGFVLGGVRFSWWRYPLAGLWFGVGGIAMHYIGMQGLIIDAELSYQPFFVLGTSIGAVISSASSLWLCTLTRPLWMQVAVAFPMGAVIASLHFFDMSGTVLSPQPRFAPPEGIPDGFAIATALAMVVLVGIAFVSAQMDERYVLNPLGFGRRRTAKKTATAWDGEDGVVIIPDPLTSDAEGSQEQ